MSEPATKQDLLEAELRIMHEIRVMRDSVTVGANIGLRAETATKDHAQWLAEHEQRMARIEQKIEKLTDLQTITEYKLQRLIDSLREGRNGKGASES